MFDSPIESFIGQISCGEIVQCDRAIQSRIQVARMSMLHNVSNFPVWEVGEGRDANWWFRWKHQMNSILLTNAEEKN